MPDVPEIFVIGGPNGGGKSTVAEGLLPTTLGVHRFINADYIAKALNPHLPEASTIEAGRIMIRRIRDLRARRVTFAFESTLSSRSFRPFLHQAQEAGYLVNILYVALASADLAVQRVRLRVERGGHRIPEETVRRRYERSLRNFFQIYQPLADCWGVWDNSGAELVRVAGSRKAKAETDVFDAERWGEIKARGEKHG